jgi:Na+-translocating ferredoxin:NAD+ oxidoreductase RnfA subunit
MTALISSALCAGLSFNLIVHFGLGIQEITEKERTPLPFLQCGVLFIGVFLLWMLFFYVFTPFLPLLLEYFLFFPLSALLCVGLEKTAEHFFPVFSNSANAPSEKKIFKAESAYNGLAVTALILTVRIAHSFAEAFITALCFPLGVILSILILNEIQKRASIEAVPPFLRGKPLRLISIGFLSLIFASTAAILLSAFAGV